MDSTLSHSFLENLTKPKNPWSQPQPANTRARTQAFRFQADSDT